jgi:FtsH-binding integral membrane protein
VLPCILKFKENIMYEAVIQETSYRTAEQVNSAMLRVYNHMLLAIVTSAVVAGLIASSPAAMAFFFTGVMKWITLFLPLVAVFVVTIALNANPPREVAVTLLHGFAAIMGIGMGAIVHVYTTGSLVMAFASSAILFATMSFYGYFTKRSLESLGQFLFVGLIAIIIASIVNIFVGSSVITMVISAIAIIIFLGLTAYDTQQIREMVSVDNPGVSVEILGALTLYLDFINIFVNLLQLFGIKNDD